MASIADCLKKFKIDVKHEDHILRGIAAEASDRDEAIEAIRNAIAKNEDDRSYILKQLEAKGIKTDDSARKLENHLKDNGYDFTVEPASVRDIDALDSAKKERKRIAENQAKLFKKKVVFVKADGPFRINGVMVPNIADTIFVDIRTDKPFDAIMAHELSHWMEQEKPAVYKQMIKSLKTVIINEAEYAKKYGIEGATKAEITKEIVGDLMGDNFTKQSFWSKVAEANPEAFKEIAAAIIKWLKGIIVKAKSNGMDSEQWVKDATKAQDIIAKAVAQYTESGTDTHTGKPMFHKVFHGSPHDHNKFDSSKIGTGEGAQAYGYGHYFAESKDVAEYYKKTLSNDDNYATKDGAVWSPNTLKNLNARVKVRDALRKDTDLTKPIAQVQEMLDRNESEKMREMLKVDLSNLQDIQARGGLTNTLGKLYEVELAPEQDEYLLWDKPLSEQSDKVKEALRPVGIPDRKMTGQEIYSYMKEVAAEESGKTGTTPSFYNSFSKEASAKLHSLGIRGIKYLDGSSRDKGEGAYNYVVFDDKDISITAKFSRAPKSLDDVEKSWDSKGITSSMSERNGIITLNKIVVPKDSRNAGMGTAAMRELTNYADTTNQQIALTPSADFGGNKVKLQAFYKRFGFRKNNEFNVMESMIRDPKSAKFSRAPKLYSKLEQALEAASDKIYSTGPQVKLWLQSNAGKLGIKKDEIYWSGIDNWLDAQGKVSKQQVVAFVRNNGVQVEDVTLGVNKKFNDKYPLTAKEDYELLQLYSKPFDGLSKDEQARYAELDTKLKVWQDSRAMVEQNNKSSKAKHNNKELTLPGGTDYKELVATVPTIEPHNAGDSTHFGDTGQGKQIGWLRMDTRDGGLFIEELQSQRAMDYRKFSSNISEYINSKFSDIVTSMKADGVLEVNCG